MYEVNTTDFKLVKASGASSSGFTDDMPEDEALYYTTTIVTKTIDSLIVQDTIHCTLDRSFKVVSSTRHKP